MKKAKGGDFNFASRAQKIDKLEFPQSTEDRFIVKANKDGVGFQWKTYDDKLLARNIDKQTFDNTVAEATRICRNLWREKQREEHKDPTKAYQPLLYVSVFLILLAFVFLLVLIYGSRDKLALLYVAVAILCLAAFVAKTWSLEPQFMDLEKVQLNKVTEYLNNQNSQIYQSKGYKWQVEPNLYWIELVSI
ncbi:unnamed protein product (macronuclear) [Paramecium tetraurelia]|uniref:Uncharacterized protein n=1 Tax=Paramecium tetraurelia TaxID=5888 RepID=A0D531_PARTE|nr:uncharacterized protein GSPATT00013595001 [Paramecium tetraurelia]CAK78148.1 unnamed protein product [Paramecium tetraurelia]|eukprot:XP_001445545.1 hypothetical protein (macronuclear) [Paramecium tetraurelia strain d4-2]